MKCCSFQRKYLEKHFDRMSRRYYSFNGMDNVNAKHTFLNSLPEPLGDETFHMMNLQKITLQQASLGEIYQHALITLEKLCNQRKFHSKIDKVHSKLKDVIKLNNFFILDMLVDILQGFFSLLPSLCPLTKPFGGYL